jgi:hypothetical protein
MKYVSVCAHVCCVCYAWNWTKLYLSYSHERAICHSALLRGLSLAKTVTCVKTCWASMHCSYPFYSERSL